MIKVQNEIKKQLEDINNLIYLYDTIINTLQEHKPNYNHILNVDDLIENVKLRDKDKV